MPATFNEVLSVSADFTSALKSLANFETEYKQFVARLNKQALEPPIKGDSIAAITEQAKQLTAELRNVAKASAEVTTAQKGTAQAVQATAGGVEQVGKAQKGAASASLGMQKSFGEIARDFPGLVRNAAVWQASWLASSVLIVILTRGKIWRQRVRILQGDESACHQNSACVYVADRIPGARIVRGYGLSKDKLWRQHSWITTPENLIETTEKCSRCFGVVLTAGEAEAMVEVRMLRALQKQFSAAGQS